MRKQAAIWTALALAACANTSSAPTPEAIQQLGAAPGVSRETLIALNAVCGAEGKAGAYSRNLKLAGGMGTGGFTVDTQNKNAQDWFDYGLALSHAFYHQDAKAAMRRSVMADPNCALCEWGLAWTLGPTLNYGIDEAGRAEALEAARKSLSLVKPGDQRALALAQAMVARYAAPSAAANGEKNVLGGAKAGGSGTEHEFGLAMQKIAMDHPDETEFAVLAAHSLLIPVRGDDNRGLKPAIALLEGVLKKKPDDTGAIHYYIHATEFDDRAEDALGYAKRLGLLAPAASHLVHMPAHTMFHAGLYEEAAVVNAKAIEADTDWLRAGGDPSAPTAGQGDPPMYYAHNLAFGLAGALMAGDSQLALKYESHANLIWPEAKVNLRGNPTYRTYVALARYAPDKMLALPDSKGSNPLFAIYRHYGRGEALLVKGDIAAAREELKALDAFKPKEGAPPPEQIVARNVLEGRIAMAEGRPRDAARFFSTAAKLQEDKMTGYMDPPQWWYPVRRSVAAAYLKAGDFAKAEAEADKSLKEWKNDPLALWVKGKAQLGAGHLGAGEATMGEAQDRWLGDFASITEGAI
ncbi:MAG TPA: hypothetical protein VG942_17335 [Hyphomonadaceae bacterium]|nr:hypothetical protein [Hyphomonadaceae bacterium]